MKIYLAEFYPIDVDGTFVCEEISSLEAADLIEWAHRSRSLQSSIKLPQVREMLEDAVRENVPDQEDFELPVARSKEERLIILKHGDCVLRVKLKPEVRPERDRKYPVEDYIFYLIGYCQPLDVLRGPVRKTTAAEIAEQIGCTPDTVTRTAREEGIGWQGARNQWFFSKGEASELAKLIRPGPGNPGFGKKK